MAFIMTTFTNELCEEMAEYDEAKIAVFLAQIGDIVAWVGHGDNDRLPEAIRPFAEHIQPSPRTPETTDTDLVKSGVIELPV